MGRLGRFVCVGMPFALTLASLVCLLIITLTGVSNNSLYNFKVNTGNLSISASDLSSLTRRSNHLELTGSAITSASSAASSVNITAADLGLADSYTTTLWNYCYTTGSTTICTPAKFDWASNATNITNTLTTIAAEQGVTFADSSLNNSVKTFSNVVKWTEIVYIIASALAAFELIIGLFAFCSRIGSCCTFLISGFSTAAAIAAAALSTVTATVVVGAVSAFNKYGVSASFNTPFLAISWLAVAFSLAASLFWMFSICCCSPAASKRKEKHRSRAGDEKPYGGYVRVNDPFGPAHTHGQETGYIPPTQPTQAQRYEPYSHTAV